MDFQQADVKCKQFDPESFDGKMINIVLGQGWGNIYYQNNHTGHSRVNFEYYTTWGY